MLLLGGRGSSPSPCCMLQEHFRSLTAGARFKRERRSEDRVLAAEDELPIEPTKSSAIAPLDFFGETPAQPAAKRSKSAAVVAAAEAEEDGEGGKLAGRQAKAQMLSIREVGTHQRAAEIRRAHRIRVSEGAPPPAETVEELGAAFGLRAYLVRNALGAGYSKLTPVQMQAIPALLGGRDLLACAPTGSGKTAAYALPLLAKLKEPARKGVRGLVVAPTRELAQQIHREFERLGDGPRFGLCVLAKPAAARGKERPIAWRKYDLLISTPLRLVHLLGADALSLASVALVVLDEADRLLELGFVEQVDEVMAACSSPSLQRAMFSATIPPAVDELARSVLREPLSLHIGERNAAAHEVEQSLVYVGREEGKLLALQSMIREGLSPPVLIFVQSKERAMQLFRSAALPLAAAPRLRLLVAAARP